MISKAKATEWLDDCGVGPFIRHIVRFIRAEMWECAALRHKFRQQNRIARYLSSPGKKKLQIGCSTTCLPGWLNTDLEPNLPDVTYLDATRPFPFPSDSLNFVLSEHFIEHITLDEAERCLKEIYRCLKPGGVLRLSTPSLDRYVSLFVKEHDEEQSRFLSLSRTKYGWSDETPCLALNHLMYNWGHKHIYSRTDLLRSLGQIGFIHVTEVELGKSDHPELCGVEHHHEFYGEEMHRFETMAFEAEKPNSQENNA